MATSNSGVQLIGAVAIAAVIMVVYLRAPIFPVALGSAIAAFWIYRRKPKE